MSIVSWDDMDDDIPLKDAENQDIALKAAQNLKNLDLTEAHKELDEQEASIKARQSRPIDVSVDGTMSDEELALKAKQTIAEIDKYLEEGGRVQVDDKQLLNCASDLNQLVPFKYNWSWSLYLTGTENHWMPSEYPLMDDQANYERLSNNNKHHIKRLLMVWRAQKLCFNVGHLLNAYRLITNPECRQYILRQSFEQSVVGHVAKELEEAFLPEGIIGTQFQQGDVLHFKKLVTHIQNCTRNATLLDFSTAGKENTENFLIELITAYVSTIVIMPLAFYIPAHKIAQSNKLFKLMAILERMMRDIQTQKNFIQLFLRTALQETPNIDIERISNVVNVNVIEFLDHLSNVFYEHHSDTRYNELRNLCHILTSKILQESGIKPHVTFDIRIDKKESDFVNEALSLLSSLEPKVNHEAGLSGSGGSLGW